MIDLSRIKNVYISNGFTDLRKSIDGFSAMVAGEYNLDPFSDSLFLFCNRQRNKIKMIYWDGNSYWLLYKRLDKKHFKWPRHSDSTEISHQQLKWLLEGLHLTQKNSFERRENMIL